MTGDPTNTTTTTTTTDVGNVVVENSLHVGRVARVDDVEPGSVQQRLQQ